MEETYCICLQALRGCNNVSRILHLHLVEGRKASFPHGGRIPYTLLSIEGKNDLGSVNSIAADAGGRISNGHKLNLAHERYCERKAERVLHTIRELRPFKNTALPVQTLNLPTTSWHF